MVLPATMAQETAAETDTQEKKLYYGQVHSKQHPRISPTSEVTRLVEVWASPEMRAPLAQHHQGENMPALDAGDGWQSFWSCCGTF